jgi:hypothetical protein
VPPGASDLECTVQTVQPGSFACQMHLFVDDGGTREVILSVSGTAQ